MDRTVSSDRQSVLAKARVGPAGTMMACVSLWLTPEDGCLDPRDDTTSDPAQSQTYEDGRKKGPLPEARHQAVGDVVEGGNDFAHVNCGLWSVPRVPSAVSDASHPIGSDCTNAGIFAVVQG